GQDAVALVQLAAPLGPLRRDDEVLGLPPAGAEEAAQHRLAEAAAADDRDLPRHSLGSAVRVGLVARVLVDHPGAAEAPHLADDRQQRPPLPGQLVLDARRRLGVAVPHGDPLPLEHVEPFRQRARADPGTGVLQLHEAARPLRQVVHDQRRPLHRDDLRGRRDRAVLVVHLLHGPFHGGAVYSAARTAASERKVGSASPRPSSHERTAAAQRRPSSIAQTTSDWPRRASPAAKTPSAEVWKRGASALPRLSRSTPSRSSSAASGPRKPIASSTSSAGRDSSVPGTRSNGGAPEFRCQWIARTRPPSPERCVVEIANERSPPSASA